MPRLGTIDDGVKGGQVEFGTFSVDPASLATATEVETAVTVTGAKVGDLVFASPISLDSGLEPKGVRVSAADTVQVAIRNNTAGTIDGAARTWQYILIHLS